MGKKRSAMAGRAWNLLRLALLWARKGGAFKRKLILDLRLVPGYLKALRPGSGRRSDRLGYREREFSFGDTPTFHFKMHRPVSMRHLRIPCINPPPVDDDYDNGSLVFYERDRGGVYDMDGGGGDCDGLNCKEEEEEENEQGGVDLKAEEFIAKFYEQMKLQRQVSYLEYNEMLNRSA